MKAIVASGLVVIGLAVSGCGGSPMADACHQINDALITYDKVPAHVRDGKAQIALADQLKSIASPLKSPDNVAIGLLSDSARTFGTTLAASNPDQLLDDNVASAQLGFLNDLSSVAVACKAVGVTFD